MTQVLPMAPSPTITILMLIGSLIAIDLYSIQGQVGPQSVWFQIWHDSALKCDNGGLGVMAEWKQKQEVTNLPN